VFPVQLAAFWGYLRMILATLPGRRVAASLPRCLAAGASSDVHLALLAPVLHTNARRERRCPRRPNMNLDESLGEGRAPEPWDAMRLVGSLLRELRHVSAWRNVIARDAHSDRWPWVCSRRSPRWAAEGLAAWAAATGRRISAAALPGESATQCGSRQRPRSRPSHREPPSLAATRSAPTNLPHWSSRSCCHGRNARRVAPRRGGTGFEGERQKTAR
jgi:hypothetical protein